MVWRYLKIEGNVHIWGIQPVSGCLKKDCALRHAQSCSVSVFSASGNCADFYMPPGALLYWLGLCRRSEKP